MLLEPELVPFQATELSGRRVLVIAPHPDDETFGCGGALALHRQAGDPVRVVFVTDGGRGDSSGSADRVEYVAARRSEANAACAELGVDDLLFWDYADRATWQRPELSERLADLLEEFRPDLIYTPSAHEIHPDHRAATHWLLQAAGSLAPSCELAFYEVSQAGVVNCLVDISPVVVAKIRAMNRYSSQLKERPYKRVTLALNRFRTLTLPSGVSHAEGFLLLPAAAFRERSFDQVVGELLARRQVGAEGSEPEPPPLAAIGPADLTTAPSGPLIAALRRWFRDHLKKSPTADSSRWPLHQAPQPMFNKSLAATKAVAMPSADGSGPLVSVVIPAYNHERYIDEAVASVLAQSHRNLEIIIVNDGSTDTTGAICRRLAERDGRIRYHEQANQGAHQALNQGIELARGDLIAILNSDDRFAHDKLERCLDIVHSQPDLGLVCGHVELIGPNGKPLKRGPAVEWQQRGYRFLAGSGLLPLSLLNENIVATTSNLFFTRDLWRRAGPFQPLRYCHDLDFLMSAFRTAPCRFDRDHTHVHYRVHPANTIQEEYNKVRLEIAAVIAASLAIDRLNLLGSQNARSVAIFRDFLNNKDLSNLIIFFMMHFQQPTDRSAFYESVLAVDRRELLQLLQ